MENNTDILKLRSPRFCGAGTCGHDLIMPGPLVVPHRMWLLSMWRPRTGLPP